MTSTQEDKLLSRAEVVERFGIPRRFLDLKATSEGGPPLIRIGRLVRYRTDDVRRWIEDNRHEG